MIKVYEREILYPKIIEKYPKRYISSVIYFKKNKRIWKVENKNIIKRQEKKCGICQNCLNCKISCILLKDQWNYIVYQKDCIKVNQLEKEWLLQIKEELNNIHSDSESSPILFQ